MKSHQQQTLALVEAQPQHKNQDKHNFTTQITSDFHQNIPSHAQTDGTTEPSH